MRETAADQAGPTQETSSTGHVGGSSTNQNMGLARNVSSIEFLGRTRLMAGALLILLLALVMPLRAEDSAAMIAELSTRDCSAIRKKIRIYTNKVCTGESAARKQHIAALIDGLGKVKGRESKAFLLRELQLVGDESAIAPVALFLKQPDLQESATQALVSLGLSTKSKAANRALITQLGSAKGVQRVTLAKALAGLRETDSGFVATMIADAASPNRAIRCAALGALAYSGDPRAVPVLKAIVDDSKHPDRKYVAGQYFILAQRLAARGNSDLAAKLCKDAFATYTGPEDGHLQCTALFRLKQIQGAGALETLAGALENRSAYVRAAANNLLSTMKGEAVSRKAAELLKTASAKAKVAILGLLAKRSDPIAQKAVLSAVKDADLEVRAAAIRALAGGGEGAVPVLLELIANGADKERRTATDALTNLKGKGVSAAVAKALPKLTSSAAKEAAVKVLSARGASDQLTTILQLAGDPEKAVRKAVFRALKALAKPEHVPAMVKALLAAKESADRRSLIGAIVAVSRSVKDAAARTAPIATGLNGAAAEQQLDLVTILAALGGKPGFDAAAGAMNAASGEHKSAIVKVLSRWIDIHAVGELTRIAGNTKDNTQYTLAIRAVIRILTSENRKGADVKSLAEAALKVARNAQEKKFLENLTKGGGKIGAVSVPVSGELAGYWSLGEVKGGMAADAGSGKRPGKLMGGVKPPAGNAVGLSFDGIDDCVNLGHHNLNAPMTIAAWIRPVDLDGKGRIVSVKRSKSNNGFGFGRSGDRLEITTYGVKDYTHGKGVLKEGVWQHVAVTFGTDHKATFYYNGVNIGSIGNSGGMAPDNDDDLMIGCGSEEFFTGGIYGVRIYKSILSDADVKKIFEASQQLTAMAPVAPPKPVFAATVPAPELGDLRPAKGLSTKPKDWVNLITPDRKHWKGSDKYIVKDDVLICQKGGGQLKTVKQYGDFVLELEFKLTPGANNGLGVRVPPKGGDPAYSAMELQILDNSSPRYAKLHPYQYHGSIYGCVPAKRGHLKPVGEWNKERVTCLGTYVKVELNGVTITEADISEIKQPMDHKKHPGLKNKRGFLALLGHGAYLEFRNMRILEDPMSKPLPGTPDNTPPPGFKAVFNGKDLTGWKGLVGNPKSRAKMSPAKMAAAQAKADASMRAHWKVEDGALVFDGKGKSLCTARDYADFEMYVTWKIKSAGDSGLYLRGTPQVQIWDTEHEKCQRFGAAKGSGGMWNNGKHPDGRFPIVKADKPVGNWNTFFVRMVGERVTIYLNGKLVIDDKVMDNYWDRSKPIYRSGQIELQNHGNTLWFKNVYIRDIF